MRTLKVLTIIFLAGFIWSCGSNSGQKQSDFSIATNAKNNTITIGETLSLSIKNPNNYKIESVSYSLNGRAISENTALTNTKIGEQTIEAKIITDLNNTSPKVYSYKIINEYPHDITSYTQGLEYYNGELYESTGQRGESKLRKVNYKTGDVLKNVDLDREYFGEGLTVLNDKVYQLTWTSGRGFV